MLGANWFAPGPFGFAQDTIFIQWLAVVVSHPYAQGWETLCLDPLKLW
jgi:hypothetical protein